MLVHPIYIFCKKMVKMNPFGGLQLLATTFSDYLGKKTFVGSGH